MLVSRSLYAFSPRIIELNSLSSCLQREVENLVADAVQISVPFNNPITGFCAFTHKAGIHAKAILANPSTYEILKPEDFGMSRYIDIGSRLTGWNAVRNCSFVSRLFETDLSSLFRISRSSLVSNNSNFSFLMIKSRMLLPRSRSSLMSEHNQWTMSTLFFVFVRLHPLSLPSFAQTHASLFHRRPPRYHLRKPTTSSTSSL